MLEMVASYGNIRLSSSFHGLTKNLQDSKSVPCNVKGLVYTVTNNVDSRNWFCMHRLKMTPIEIVQRVVIGRACKTRKRSISPNPSVWNIMSRYCPTTKTK